MWKGWPLSFASSTFYGGPFTTNSLNMGLHSLPFFSSKPTKRNKKGWRKKSRKTNCHPDNKKIKEERQWQTRLESHLLFRFGCDVIISIQWFIPQKSVTQKCTRQLCLPRQWPSRTLQWYSPKLNPDQFRMEIKKERLVYTNGMVIPNAKRNSSDTNHNTKVAKKKQKRSWLLSERRIYYKTRSHKSFRLFQCWCWATQFVFFFFVLFGKQRRK